jgi:DNA-directed RNA polymerase subunit RPC12/RpoP
MVYWKENFMKIETIVLFILKRLKVLIIGGAFGIGMIVFGIMFLFIPFIGWVIGGSMIIMGLMMPLVAVTVGDATTGVCPRCSNRIVFKPLEKGTTCSLCHYRVILTKTGLELA